MWWRGATPDVSSVKGGLCKTRRSLGTGALLLLLWLLLCHNRKVDDLYGLGVELDNLSILHGHITGGYDVGVEEGDMGRLLRLLRLLRLKK